MRHLTDEIILRYIEAKLNAEELREMKKHISGCTYCRDKLKNWLAFNRDLTDWMIDMKDAGYQERVWRCLTYEEIISYLEDKIAGEEKEEVEAHLRICSSCREAIASLRWLREISQEELKLEEMSAAPPDFLDSLREKLEPGYRDNVVRLRFLRQHPSLDSERASPLKLSALSEEEELEEPPRAFESIEGKYKGDIYIDEEERLCIRFEDMEEIYEDKEVIIHLPELYLSETVRVFKGVMEARFSSDLIREVGIDISSLLELRVEIKFLGESKR